MSAPDATVPQASGNAATLGDDAALPPLPDASAPPVTVEALTPTPLPPVVPPDVAPHIAFTAPRTNETVRGGRVEIRLDVRGWPAPTDGKHVLLVLDNEPARRIDEPGVPYSIEGLSAGTHVLRAFLAWSSHESVKADGAFALVVFNAERATQGLGFNPRAPMLTYSQPAGDYLGSEGDAVLLDFYVSNAALGPGQTRVRYNIDGATGVLTAWVPYVIHGLSDGPHDVQLDLIGPDNLAVPGIFNHADRQITVHRAR